MTLTDFLNTNPNAINNAKLKGLLGNQSLPVTTNPIATYTPNNYLTSQLARVPFQASPSMLQAYNNKMQGYGITPQPFVGSPQSNGSPAPVKGGK